MYVKQVVSRVICGFLPVFVLLLVAITPVVSAKAAYDDIRENAWYSEAVTYVTEKGYFSGTGNGKFQPNITINRAMFLTALANGTGNYKKADYDSAGFLGDNIPLLSPLPYDDVDPFQWYAAPVRWATRAEIASGKGNGHFEPLAAVTREEAVTLLYRYAEKTGNDITHTGGASTLSRFTDGGTVSQWARNAMEWAVEKGIIHGFPDGRIAPKSGMTRAEAATILWAAKDVLRKNEVRYPMTSAADRLGITADNYPKVDGAKLTQSLANELYYAMHGVVDPQGFRHSRTIPAYEKLAAGEVDLILVPDVTDDVLDPVRKAGVSVDAYEIAREGMVFLTPESNSTNGITIEQARAIYARNAITNWSQMGGPDKELIPLCGDAATNDVQFQLERLVLNGASIAKAIRDEHTQSSISELYQQTAFYSTGATGEASTDAYALGYGYYTAPGWMDSYHLKMLPMDSVAATKDSIADRSYPLTYSYYAVVRSDLPANHPARRLAKWLQTAEGKKVVEAANMIAPK